MKKNILLIAAALFLFLGNQSVSAQAKMKKNTQSIGSEKTELSAKEKTTNLIRPLSLNKKQQEQVYSLFANIEGKMRSESMDGDAHELEVKQAKIDKHITAKIKEILTEEQFKKYLELSKAL